jgi:hypothetical protein
MGETTGSAGLSSFPHLDGALLSILGLATLPKRFLFRQKMELHPRRTRKKPGGFVRREKSR